MHHYTRRPRSRMQFHPRILSNPRYGVSNPSELNAMSETTKVGSSSCRCAWYCFLLLISVVMFILIYIDFGRFIYAGYFALSLVALLLVYSFVYTQIRMRRNRELDGAEEMQAETEPGATQSCSDVPTPTMEEPSNVCTCQMSATATPVHATLPLQHPMELGELPSLNLPLQAAVVAVAPVSDSYKDDPPPYHEAVRLPTPLSLESPPPSYEDVPI